MFRRIVAWLPLILCAWYAVQLGALPWVLREGHPRVVQLTGVPHVSFVTTGQRPPDAETSGSRDTLSFDATGHGRLYVRCRDSKTACSSILRHSGTSLRVWLLPVFHDGHSWLVKAERDSSVIVDVATQSKPYRRFLTTRWLLLMLASVLAIGHLVRQGRAA